MDTRDEILRLLRAHASTLQKGDAHEAAMTAATMVFVETHLDCAERTQIVGHLTGSSWIVNTSRTRVLLTHHRKLGKWLQLGGHADGDLDLARVAFREAQEESGLKRIRLVSPALFDVDRHRIPARSNEPEHWHYDLRFLFEADPDEPLVTSSESKALAWVELARIHELTTEDSIARMVRKTQR